MKAHTLLAAAMLVAGVNCRAELPRLGLGMAFAPIAGNGFSVRYLPESKWGWQAGAVFFKSSDHSFANVGGAALWVIKHESNTAIYLPIGASFSYSNQLEMEGPDDHEVRRRSSNLDFGAGLGLTGHLAGMDDIWLFADLVILFSAKYIGPMPQIGVHYYLK